MGVGMYLFLHDHSVFICQIFIQLQQLHSGVLDCNGPIQGAVEQGAGYPHHSGWVLLPPYISVGPADQDGSASLILTMCCAHRGQPSPPVFSWQCCPSPHIHWCPITPSHLWESISPTMFHRLLAIKKSNNLVESSSRTVDKSYCLATGVSSKHLHRQLIAVTMAPLMHRNVLILYNSVVCLSCRSPL